MESKAMDGPVGRTVKIDAVCDPIGLTLSPGQRADGGTAPDVH